MQGFLLVAPFGITIYIIYTLFMFADSLLKDWLIKLTGLNIPGLGLLIIVILLIGAGMVGQTFIARPFKRLFANIINRTPLLKVIY